MASIRLHTTTQDQGNFIKDVGIISGYIASSYILMKVAPHVRPATTALVHYSGPYWNELKRKAQQIQCPATIGSIATLIRQKNRKSLVRWLGSNLPSWFFAPAPRICVLMRGITYVSADEILRSRQIRPALSELEEFNDEGIIVAYAKTSDTESEVMEPTDSAPEFVFGETWPNPNFSMKFDPWAGGCSTPMNYSSPVHNWLATSVNPTFPVEDSAAQEVTAAKIATLEAELAKMKAMCEMILQNQASACTVPTLAVAAPVIPLVSPPCEPKPSVAPPPPPPPAPPVVDHSAPNKVIKLKTKSELEPVSSNGVMAAPAKAVPLSMSDVLKGLGGVKLKPVERSPGGTPFKPKPIANDLDPASMIAAALKKRFASIQSPVTTDDDDSLCDKENQLLNTSDDSFTRSPSFFQFGTSMQKSTKLNTSSSTVLKRSCLNQKLNTSIPRKRKSTGSPAESSVPLFGQHLLKRRISSSLLKKQARLSLHDENTE